MSKKAFELFLAVGTPERRSSLWRTWGTQAGDVYLVNCEAATDFKLSMHVSGRCHLSFRTPELQKAAQRGTHPYSVLDDLPGAFAKAKSKGEGRFEDVWEPSEIAPGLVLPFRLCMPDSELRPLRRVILNGRDVRWLPTPGHGHAVEVAFWAAASSLPASDVPGAESMGNRLLFRIELPPPRTVLMTWRAYGLSQEDQMWVAAYRPSILPVSDLVARDAHGYDYHRCLVHVHDAPYSSRAFIDTAMA